jgi:hypothetical protein
LENIYRSRDREWKREEGGDEGEHDILVLGGGQDLDSRQQSLHMHRYSIQQQQGRSEIREEEVLKEKRRPGMEGRGGGETKKEEKKRE